MSATVSRYRSAARKRVVYAFDAHGDLVFDDELDDEQGSNARPSGLEALARARHLAISWGAR